MISLIKQAAIEAVDQSSPTTITYGIVTKIKPLEIDVEQKMRIYGSMILLTSNVMNKEVEVAVNDLVEENGAEPHRHKYIGKKKQMHNNGLKIGEKVLLIRAQGGQKYIVLDRLVSV